MLRAPQKRRLAANISRLIAILTLACLPRPLVAAADFPPITDAESALDALPWQPGAPAVVLFHKGEPGFSARRAPPAAEDRVLLQSQHASQDPHRGGQEVLP